MLALIDQIKDRTSLREKQVPYDSNEIFGSSLNRTTNDDSQPREISNTMNIFLYDYMVLDTEIIVEKFN